MKTEGSVRHKIQQATFRHLKRALKRGMARRPDNCAHNVAVGPLPGNVHVRACSVQAANGVFPPCDEAYGGLEKAAACPLFKAARTPEEIRQGLVEFFRTAPVEQVAAQFPDVAALRWVVGDGTGYEEPAPPAARHLPVLVADDGTRGYRFVVLGAGGCPPRRLPDAVPVPVEVEGV